MATFFDRLFEPASAAVLSIGSWRVVVFMSVLLAVSSVAFATQTDITGPVGSGQFGASVTALPNGNFVVIDTLFDDGAVIDVGAVYLYNGSTLALISTLKGSTASDNTGSSGVSIFANGNFIVRSPNWDDGATANVGELFITDEGGTKA